MHLTTQYFRLPSLTATAQIQWVQDPKLCKFIRNLVAPGVGIDELLQILLERLAAPTVERSVLDACTAFAAGVILPASRHFHYELHQTLRRYHPAAALELGDLLQMVSGAAQFCPAEISVDVDRSHPPVRWSQ
jgi:hypothetical protein